ncbi:MAG: GNAT family N-acetyltransferase [Bacteroidia bacterium]|jgi:GNAT superfamily N-acetyltransferase
MNPLSEKKFVFYSWNDKEYWKAVELRRLVLRFPIGKNYGENDFILEKNELFFGCFSSSEDCLATISAKELNSTTWKMRQFAVHPLFQKTGIGGMMVHFYEQEARMRGIENIEFHARKKAVPFYQKLGYSVVSDEFLEVEIPHFKMEKKL